MEKRLKVSVIIPTYNRKAFLPEAIDSVLNQTYRDIEIIVVDDGSTDGTGDLLKERYGDTIRYYYKANGGCASARNAGIKISEGEYIAFLDSDDMFLPEKLEDQAAVLDSHRNVGLVYSDSYALAGKEMKLSHSIRPDKNRLIALPLFMTTFLANGSFLVRRECIEKAGYYSERLRYNEDTDFLLRIALDCNVYFSNKPTFAYRLHEGRKSGNSIKLLEALYDSTKTFLERYPAFRERIGKNANSRLAQIKLDLVVEHMLANDYDKALGELETSFRLYPSPRKSIYRFLFRRGLIRSARLQRAVLFVETVHKIFLSYWYA